LHQTANLKAGTKSPRHTIAFILIKIDFANKFLLSIISASSIAERNGIFTQASFKEFYDKAF